MARIPLDILDLIFAELQPLFAPTTFCGGIEAPKEDLRSCTLVCREWKPLATAHIFRAVGYSFVYRLDALAAHDLHATDDPTRGALDCT